MTPSVPLDDRVAVVTGAASGIGRGIACRLAADGALVVLGDLDADGLDGTRTILEGPGAGKATSFVGDLSNPDVAAALIQAATDTFGHVDILVNNAGGGVILPTLSHTEDTLRRTIDANLWTAIHCTLAALPPMLDAGHGRIINIGAESVRNGLAMHAMYNAAKGGVHGMTTGLAREFAAHGITVNTVAPSMVETEQVAAARAGARTALAIEAIDATIPLGRAATVDEVASMVAYLASPEAGFVTGQVISVNGGSSML